MAIFKILLDRAKNSLRFRLKTVHNLLTNNAEILNQAIVTLHNHLKPTMRNKSLKNRQT